ncbi:phosphotransferase [Moritella sp. 36]|uniref:phosphotransferase family protein n=1 Tax=Moritella sp. 36 TaxID=2746233 RepID=UPI001BA7204E|nr:hypothetical protein [Moritella sp. 36]QUM87884.1 phosphotransferase [Moritella sp. 36]
MEDINYKLQAASHSGASLTILEIMNEYFVKKDIDTSIDKNFLAAIKQKNFKKIKTPTYEINAIPITNIIKKENFLSITMPYAEGLGGEKIAYKGSKVVARNLKVALNFYLINNFSMSAEGTVLTHEIYNKLDEIKNKTKGKDNIFPMLSECISKVKSFCNEDLKIPIGPCHGDLTLSNLKITEENQLLLFDFLSCEINSPLQDAAKLLQDFEYGWSFRHEKDSIRIKCEIFCEYAIPYFIKALDKLYYYEMRVIEALTILRIAPYIKSEDKVTQDWFNETINKIMNKLKG